MTNLPTYRCFVGLGSNLAKPMQQLGQAIEALAALADCQLGQVSGFYMSQPMGPQNQPDYVNAVAELTTVLSAHDLLDCLQAIEGQQGRVRDGERWGPRTLDLDLLLYAQQHFQDERLTVPHYGLAQRNFVLYPLAEIVEKDFAIPGLGELTGLLEQCPKDGLVRIN